jgi:uncharacterized membrane protein YjfL (UPF0719 family)
VVVGVGAPVDWFAPVFGFLYLVVAILCAYVFFLLFRWFTKYLERRKSDNSDKSVP